MNREHEAVELGLGQGIGAFEFDRVLGGEHEEGGGQVVGPARDGDLVLLHGLKQGGLGLGRGAVYLVGEDDIGEDRAGNEAEAAPPGLFVLVNDLGAGDVRGHQVGRELHPVEGEFEHPGDGVDEQGLGETGHADQQAVAVGQQADERLLDDRLLADDDLADFAFDAPARLAEPARGLDVAAPAAGSVRLAGHADSLMPGTAHPASVRPRCSVVLYPAPRAG